MSLSLAAIVTCCLLESLRTELTFNRLSFGSQKARKMRVSYSDVAKEKPPNDRWWEAPLWLRCVVSCDDYAPAWKTRLEAMINHVKNHQKPQDFNYPSQWFLWTMRGKGPVSHWRPGPFSLAWSKAVLPSASCRAILWSRHENLSGLEYHNQMIPLSGQPSNSLKDDGTAFASSSFSSFSRIWKNKPTLYKKLFKELNHVKPKADFIESSLA